MPATGGGDASFLRDISDGKGKLLVDRDGLPHFGGAEDWLDDWDQVCEDYFYGLKADERKHAASRVKGKLFDNAKLLTKADAGVSYEKIEAMAETKAREALKLIQTTVRSRCEKAKVINEKDAFVGYFFKSHKRKWGENPPAFQQRRDDEYVKMVKAVSTESDPTALSQNVRNFFLMHGMGLSDEEEINILRNTGNKYSDTDKLMENLRISHGTIGDKEVAGERNRPKKKFKGTPKGGAGVGKGASKKSFGRGRGSGYGSKTFLGEAEEEDYDEEEDDDEGPGIYEQEPEEEEDAAEAWYGDGETKATEKFDRGEALCEFQSFLEDVDLTQQR
jgi:hypothetical protein